jgi:hypothetical protein
MLNRQNFEIAKLTDEEAGVVLVTPKATYVHNGAAALKVTAPEVEPTLFPPTDGIDPAEHFTAFQISRDAALELAALIPKQGERSGMIAAIDCSTEGNARCTIAVNKTVRESIIRADKVDQMYPDVNRVIPGKRAAAITIAFDVELLCNVIAAVQKFSKATEAGTVVFRIIDAQRGMRIDCEGIGQTLTGVIMPQRYHEKEEKV